MYTARKERHRVRRFDETHGGSSMSLSSVLGVADATVLDYPAWIETITGLIDCVILRITAAGAEIRLEEAKTPGDEFDLWLTRNGACRRRCHLVESDGVHLRVRFDREAASFVTFKRAIALL
jgi:hypothetical protein